MALPEALWKPACQSQAEVRVQFSKGRVHGVHQRAKFAQFPGAQSLSEEGASPTGKKRMQLSGPTDQGFGFGGF